VDGLLVAIVDIDEVIQVIRSSDDARAARERLRTVFDLSEPQAEYILELQLRRLTKFSRLELEKEQDALREEIARLQEILGDDAVLRGVVSAEMAEVAKTYGTPRRTILLESAGAAPTTTAAVPLEVADTPCWALFSATGLLARTSDGTEPARTGPRAAHDVLRARVLTTARGEVGLVTSRGRIVRVSALDLPAIPPTDGAPSLSGGVPLSEVVALDPGEEAVTIAALDADAPPLALGTAQGVVKRVLPGDVPNNRDAWEVVSLKDGDVVVGAAPATDADEVVFVSTDASLLHFDAASVRPQGRAAGGMAGIRLADGHRVAFFGVVPADVRDLGVVVTVAGSADALPGTQTGAAKVTPYELYPGKGRGTGGVRAQRFLKGEDALILAWVGQGPARATGSGGQVAELPEVDQRRDGSGTPLPAPVVAVG